MIQSERLTARTPAKINLGLEVTGRRDDGYHSIVTILQAVSIYDEFVWQPDGCAFRYDGTPSIPTGDDLVNRVLNDADTSQWTGRLTIEKHIPVSAGLGGGSSDAAMALRLANHSAPEFELTRQASTIGSDVPFFVRGGTALASGRGIDLEPLPTPHSWFVIVVPPLTIEQKTRTLYSGLREKDYSDGSTIIAAASEIQAGRPLQGYLPNAFVRQLRAYSTFASAVKALENAGARRITTSGAGPAILAYFHDERDAVEVAERMKGQYERVFLASAVSEHSHDPAVTGLARALRGGSSSG